MTQGSTRLITSHLVVTQDADGFHKGVATGGKDGLAYYKEKLDDKDAFVEGKGERIEYNGRNDQAEFFVRAWIKHDEDEVWGQYIFYDSLTDKFFASNTNKGQMATATPEGVRRPRVRAIIMPQEKKPADPSAEKETGTALKPSTTLSPQQ